MVLSVWMFLGFIAHGLITGYNYKFNIGVFLESKGFKISQMTVCMIGGVFVLKEGWEDNPWFKYGWRIW